MTNKNYSEMTFKELLDAGKADGNLSDLAIKFEEDSLVECECPEDCETDTEPTAVIVKEGSVSDSDAKLSYKTKIQTIYAHALIHLWWNMPEKTKWTRLQISREHTRIIARLVSNGWGHMLVDSLDDTLPQSLMKDFPPSNGEEVVKPTKIIIVTNSKKKTVEQSEKFSNNAPIVDTSGLEEDEIGSMKVILNQTEFAPSVTFENNNDEDDQEYKKYLDSDGISEIIESNSDALYLRINAMHEGTWNFTEISREELEKAAHTFKGRMVIEGHKWDDPERSLGEVLKASVKFDPELQKYYLEVIAKITKPRGINEVKAGRYKFVSIGATMKARCNLCGRTVSEGCQHIRGVEYYSEEHGSMLCIKIASEIMFEELSFINVPAARWARVLEELDPTQARELLAASKSSGTISIEVESNNNRILPTLDELLSLQEESIIKLYNKKEEDSCMVKDKKQEVEETVSTEETFAAPGSAAPAGAPDAATPQNTVVEPTETTPPPEKQETPGNVSEVEAPSGNPVDGGTVDTGDREASKEEVPEPEKSESDPDANASEVTADEHPKDGGTVDTGDGVNTTGEAEEMNPLVRSDEVTEEENVQDDTVTLSDDQIDEMDIGAIYEYAKTNSMTALIETLVAANDEKECEDAMINVESANEAVLAHALLHRWLDDLTLTNWSEEHINAEHDRIVAVLEGFNIGHETEETAETTEEVQSAETTEEATVEETPTEENTSEEVDSSEVTNVEEATVEETPAENTLNAEVELLSLQLEEANGELKAVQEKYDAAINELTEVKDSSSKEIYELKLNLAKSIRKNKKLEADLETANNLIATKTSEIEMLNEKVSGYAKQELVEVVDELVAVKTDMNKYADEEAVNKDRERFSKMSLDSLKMLLGELKEIKGNSLKNKAAEEHGLGEGAVEEPKTEEKIEAANEKTEVVSGDSEMETYQKEGEDVSEGETTQEEVAQEEVKEVKTFSVKEGSVLALVKESLEL